LTKSEFEVRLKKIVLAGFQVFPAEFSNIWESEMERIAFKTEKIAGEIDVIIFSLKGEMDHYTFPKVREAVSLLVNSGIKALVVNLDGLEYLDSSSISYFATLQRELKNKIPLFFAAPSPTLMKYLSIARADKVLQITLSVDLAVKKIFESIRKGSASSKS